MPQFLFFFYNKALTYVRLHPINIIKPKKKSTTPLTYFTSIFGMVTLSDYTFKHQHMYKGLKVNILSHTSDTSSL